MNSVRLFSEYTSPLGTLLLEADDAALLSVHIRPTVPSVPAGESAVLRRAAAWLDRYFAGEPVAPDALPLRPTGTPFRQLVWHLLTEIPYGETVSYGELAAKCATEMGVARMSAQAVGGAVGANPLPIIIPCHRVLAAGGKLGGFSCGLEIKRRLLTLEGIRYRE